MNKIQVRRGLAADAPALTALVAGLSPRTAFLRFAARGRAPASAGRFWSHRWWRLEGAG